jgi:hypothetical protein
MNQTNTVMLAILVALATTTGLVTALNSVATPAHAVLHGPGPCPNSPGELCATGGRGEQGGGFGFHGTTNPVTGDISSSGGEGHVGGSHVTSNFITGQFRCVGSACP